MFGMLDLVRANDQAKKHRTGAANGGAISLTGCYVVTLVHIPVNHLALQL